MNKKSSQELGPKQPTRLERLQKQSLELQQELDVLKKVFSDGFSEAIFDYISEKSIGEFMAKWLERVRQETGLLANADELGIRIFGSNLDRQDNLPFQKYSKDITISFDPNLDLTHVGKPTGQGYSEPGGKMKLKGPEPSQKDQLLYFIENGQLHPIIANLVHELVHAYHHDTNLEMDNELGESQAYANGVIEALPFDSVELTTEHISRDYGFPKDRIISIVKNILFLYSHRESTKVVAEKLRAVKAVFQGNWAVEEFFIKPIFQAEGVSEEEKDEMINVYLLQNQINRAKAQNIFLDVFGEWIKG